MNLRRLAGGGLALLISAGVAGGYFYWVHEEPRAAGPLAQALVERFDPDERRPDLNDLFAAYVDPALPLTEQQTILQANGFDCFISQDRVNSSAYLSCRRPIEGRRYCDRHFYFNYQTAAGETIERLTTVQTTAARDAIFGRCPYEPFPADEDVLRFPHDG